MEDFLRFKRMFLDDHDKPQQTLINQLKRIKAQIMKAQQNYQRDVHKLYDLMLPFSGEPRPCNQTSLGEELNILRQMIAHCIVLDSPSILYQYAIEPIRNDPTMLSHFNEMDMYIVPFTERYNKLSQKADPSQYSEILYLGKLINELQLIASSNTSNVANQVTYPDVPHLTS